MLSFRDENLFQLLILSLSADQSECNNHPRSQILIFKFHNNNMTNASVYHHVLFGMWLE